MLNIRLCIRNKAWLYLTKAYPVFCSSQRKHHPRRFGSINVHSIQIDKDSAAAAVPVASMYASLIHCAACGSVAGKRSVEVRRTACNCHRPALYCLRTIALGRLIKTGQRRTIPNPIAFAIDAECTEPLASALRGCPRSENEWTNGAQVEQWSTGCLCSR